MTDMKLTYFELPGRAESVRLALVISKIPYEDEPVFFEDWPTLKPKTPLGSLPVLTVNGKEVVQTQAMLRYVGKLGKLYPEDPWEALMVDQVSETVLEFFEPLLAYTGNDKEELKKVRDKVFAEAGPRYLGGLEKILAGISEGPYVLGNRVSTADLTITWIFTIFSTGFLEFVPKHALDGYKRMKQSFEAVLKIPEVQKYHGKYPGRAPSA